MRSGRPDWVGGWFDREPGMPIRKGLRSVFAPAAEATVVFSALILALLGLVLPSHDYAGMGDLLLDRFGLTRRLGGRYRYCGLGIGAVCRIGGAFLEAAPCLAGRRPNSSVDHQPVAMHVLLLAASRVDRKLVSTHSERLVGVKRSRRTARGRPTGRRHRRRR